MLVQFVSSMDMEQLQKKTPEELIALSRTIKSNPFVEWDIELLHKITIVYEKLTEAHETRVGISNVGNSMVE
jgi:hypothetical protein